MTLKDDSDADDVLMCSAWDTFATTGDAKNDAEGDIIIISLLNVQVIKLNSFRAFEKICYALHSTYM